MELLVLLFLLVLPFVALLLRSLLKGLSSREVKLSISPSISQELSPSSSSTSPQEKYDVFLSFRGVDTRENFTSHLYSALCQKKVKTFIDYQLQKGDEITPSLLKAILESKISIIVFSKYYASSRWCLEELAEIIDCKKRHGQHVIPVFYHVQPTDVRHQTGTFAEAFEEHAKDSKRLNKLERWKTALMATADLSGFNSDEIRLESKLIENIVEDVLKRLNGMSEIEYPDLIVIESKIREMESLLCLTSTDVCTVGIWGIGGIGKTTLANVVFSKISSQFEASYFVHNVRERSEKSDGLVLMQRELLSTILNDDNLNTDSHLTYRAFVRNRLGSKKVLIVFDDVTDSSQIESLVENLDLFGSGSRFIITTRDRQVLINYDVEKIYKVEELADDEAVDLFYRYAFKKCNAKVEFIELSNMVVTYAKGVPLVLKVLGSSLRGKTEKDWRSTLAKLKNIPHASIQKVLKISYDGLDDDFVKNIFLDIACFFKSERTDRVTSFLDACGFFADSGLSVLVQKSLITIENNMIIMHDLIQEMGKEVVRQESKDLGERSRLWNHEDIYHVLTSNSGTKAIEAICLDMSKIRDIYLSPHAFASMHRLRFFKFYNSCHEEFKNKVHSLQGLEFTSTKLSYFRWDGCPLKSLGSNFHPNYLVELHIPRSSIEQLWNGVKDLDMLKHIDLSESKYLTSFPDFSLATNLEVLNLSGIDLSGCSNMKTIQNKSCIVHDSFLDEYVIEELPSCNRSPDEIETIEAWNVVEARRTASRAVLPSIIHSNMCCLTELYVADCGITELPNSLGWLSSLKVLYANKNKFESVPANIEDLSQLESLDLSYCERLHSLPELPGNLCSIDARYCTSLEQVSGLPFLFKSMISRPRSFNFVNCFKLDRKALRDIVEDNLLKLRDMGTASWTEMPILAQHHSCIYVPGSEIPVWFNFQSSGDSLTLQLPPGIKTVGTIICNVVSFQDYKDYSSNDMISEIRCHINGREKPALHFGWYFLRPEDGPHYFGLDESSDHVFYYFHIIDVDESDHGYDASNELCFNFFINQVAIGCKVIKCGVHLLFARDSENQWKSCWGGTETIPKLLL